VLIERKGDVSFIGQAGAFEDDLGGEFVAHGFLRDEISVFIVGRGCFTTEHDEFTEQKKVNLSALRVLRGDDFYLCDWAFPERTIIKGNSNGMIRLYASFLWYYRLER
jgi:hypothetical protein